MFSATLRSGETVASDWKNHERLRLGRWQPRHVLALDADGAVD